MKYAVQFIKRVCLHFVRQPGLHHLCLCMTWGKSKFVHRVRTNSRKSMLMNPSVQSLSTQTHSLSAEFFCHPLGQWEWLLLQRWSRLYSWLFVEEIKVTIKDVMLICQCVLTHNGGAHAFVACDILNRLLHIFGVVDVKFSLQTLLISRLRLIDVSL